jgi:hypothetical protein
VWCMLGGELAALQAPIFNKLSADPFTLLDDGLRPAEIGDGGLEVVQVVVIALMFLMLDERFDLLLKVAGQEVVFHYGAVDRYTSSPSQ